MPRAVQAHPAASSLVTSPITSDGSESRIAEAIAPTSSWPPSGVAADSSGSGTGSGAGEGAGAGVDAELLAATA